MSKTDTTISARSHTATAAKTTVKADADLVLVPAIVTDSRNRIVGDLSKKNFAVYQDKHAQTIKNLWCDDAPMSVGILLDTSRSMADKMDSARGAVKAFLEAANPEDEFLLLTFADQPEILSEFTNDVDGMENKVLFAQARGHTALLDAIYLGMSQMRRARNKRKALLIISDGGDNHSRYSEREVKFLVNESDVQIFAVGLFDDQPASSEEAVGPNLLAQITNAGGGGTFVVSDPNDLSEVTANVAALLRNEYVLAYRPHPDTHDMRWHKIRVKVRQTDGHSRLHVSAKQGYYAR